MKTLLALLFLSASVALALDPDTDAQGARRRPESNLLYDLRKPAEQQSDSIKEVARTLAGSAVTNERDAEGLALAAVGLDMRDLWETTGLYRTAVAVPDFAQEDDLVWEVRTMRGMGFPTGASVSSVVWVCARTKATLILFPGDGKRKPVKAR